MFHIILFEPEIPPNTGNIIRLCANTGCQLHLIKPLGFVIDDKRMRRAGLDYREYADVQIYDSLAACYQVLQPQRVFACSTKGRTYYNQIDYQSGDVFLFGPETRGLPNIVLTQFDTDHIIKIPMQADSRSLNLSNSVAVIVYEAWRQSDFILT